MCMDVESHEEGNAGGSLRVVENLKERPTSLAPQTRDA